MIGRISFLSLLGLVVGAVVGVLAVGFVELVLWMNGELLVTASSRQALADPMVRTALLVGIPTVAGLGVGLLSRFMPGNRFHSLQDAIETAHTPHPVMPVRRSALSSLAAVVSLGAGASVGQYGPLAHMGASIGSWLSRLTRGDRSVSMISIACGCAAAISAAFHAPIAGLVFSREVVLRHYSLRAFAPIAVASIIGYVIDHVVFNRTPLFRTDDLTVAAPWEYLVFIAIGILGAFVATAFMRAIEIAGSLAQKLEWPVPIKTALAGLAIGIVALEVPEVLGIGQETLRMAMNGDALGAADLLTILVVKLLVTALCLGFGFVGGVFSPALLIGTLFGAFIGTGAQWFVGEPHSPIAIYAVCGMVAVTGPVIGAPLTAVLIVFELTQSFELATAALASVAFANLIAFRIYGRSFFDVQLQKQGFDLRLGRDKVMAQQRTIRPLIDMEYTVFDAQRPLREIREGLINDKRSEAYVTGADGAYVGTLTLHRIMEIASSGTSFDEPAGNYATPETLVLSQDDTIWDAMSRLEDFVGESIPVVDDGRLVGILFESTIVSAYLELMDSIRREDHAAL
jgi:CIC family chloride channel protein